MPHDKFEERKSELKKTVRNWLDGEKRSVDQLLFEIDAALYDVRRLTFDEAHSYADNYPNERPFLAGDSVVHLPSGEHWMLACDQQDDDVIPAGWPECNARATHCRLIKRAEAKERIEMLTRVSRTRDDHGLSTRRSRLASYQLDQLIAAAGEAEAST